MGRIISIASEWHLPRLPLTRPDARKSTSSPSQTLFALQYWFNFDAAPDGRFLISTAADPEAARNFRLTQNWPALLSR